MARYRKIHTCMWADAKFMRLSPPKPCAQWLWVHLLAGEQTGPIPGVFKIGEAAFAEQLGWSLEAFREAFREVLSEGLAKADWKARFVWVPNAPKYNPPESPNVVISWADFWNEMPECSLKADAWQSLKGFTEGLGEAFAKAFVKACRKAMPNQEQEQEQEQEPPIVPQGTFESPVKQPSEDGSYSVAFLRFWEVYPPLRRTGKRGAWKAWQSAVKRAEAETILAAASDFAASSLGRSRFCPGPTPWLNQDRWEDDREAWQRGGDDKAAVAEPVEVPFPEYT